MNVTCFRFVEVEYSVIDGESKTIANASLGVTVLRRVKDLISPAVFAGEPATYVNEPMHFVFLAARHHSTMEYEVDYGDSTPPTTFEASGQISIPDWAGAAAATAFGKDVPRCSGGVFQHVYKTVGTYTARVRVSQAHQSPGGRYDEVRFTTAVNATERQRTLAQLMSSARVYRRLSVFDDEYVEMLFRADEFSQSLSLSVNFGDAEEPLDVEKMSGDSVPSWFTQELYKDITVRKSTATVGAVNATSSHRNPFFGVEIGRTFARPGTYDVEFVVSGTLPDTDAPQRALIVARVDVRQTLMMSQLAGGPLIFAHLPVYSGTTADLLVVVRRMIRGVEFSVDFGDGTSEPVSVELLPSTDLPIWLLTDTFSSPEPFTLTGRTTTYYGSMVRHPYHEPGIYSALVKISVLPPGPCDTFTSQPTIIHVIDRSVPSLSELLGDDALVVSTPLLTKIGFQAFYVAEREVAGARYTFSFGDGTKDRESRSCTEWPHIDDSPHGIAGRLSLKEARNGSAAVAVCISHVYSWPGNYTVRVRVMAPPLNGVAQKTWNLAGQVTVLQGETRPTNRTTITPTTPVSVLCRVFHWRH